MEEEQSYDMSGLISACVQKLLISYVKPKCEVLVSLSNLYSNPNHFSCWQGVHDFNPGTEEEEVGVSLSSGLAKDYQMRPCLRTHKQKQIIFPNRREPSFFFFIVIFIYMRLVKNT